MDDVGLCFALTIPQVVCASGIGRSSIYKAIANGDLKARKVGGRTIILIEDLNAWLQNLPTVIPSGGRI